MLGRRRVVGRRVVAEEHELDALQAHHPIGLGPAPVVADAHPDQPAEQPPDAEAEVADVEVALLEMLERSGRLVLGVAGQMDLAILPDDAADGVHEDRRVVAAGDAGLLGDLRVAHTEREAQAARLLEQGLGLRPRHLGLEERVDIALLPHVPAREERRQGQLREDHEVTVTGPGLAQQHDQAHDHRAAAVVAGDRTQLGGADGDGSHTVIFQSRVAPNCRTPFTFLRKAPGTTNCPHGTYGTSS